MFQRAQHNYPNRIQWLASRVTVIERLMVIVEDLKIHIVEVSGVKDTLGHFLLGKSLSTKPSERETLRLVHRDPNLVKATNNINVLIFVLHICLRARLCLAHTTYFIWCLWTSHRTLLASLSSNFLFGVIKREGERAVWTTDSLSAWDQLIFSSKMTLSSDILPVQFKERS